MWMCIIYFRYDKLWKYNLIKKLIKVIDFQKFNYLKGILILNKLDILNEIKISKNEIKNFISNLIYLEMNLNDDNNFQKIKNRINECINNNELLSSNLITKFYGDKSELFFLENIML